MISDKSVTEKPTEPKSPSPPDPSQNRLIILDNLYGENMLGALPMLIQSDYWLGVRVGTVPPALFTAFGVKEGDPAKDGEYDALLYVEEVVADGPAEKSGLQRGDVILKCGGKKIGTLADLIAWVDGVKDSEQTLVVYRRSGNQELKITPSLRPEDARIGRQTPPGPMQPFPGMDPRQGDEMMRRMQEEMQRFRQGVPMPMAPWPQGPPKPRAEGGILPPDIGTPDGRDEPGTDIRQEAGTATEVRSQSLRTSTRVQATGDNVERLEVSERIVNGKKQIRVKRVTRKGEEEDEKVWEVDSVDELPEEIRDDVQAMLPK